MKYAPLYTALATVGVLVILLATRQPSKIAVYEAKTPSYLKNNLEFTSDKQFIEIDGHGNVTIR